MAIHSNIPAWRIPWTEEPGRVQSMGSRRVRHDSATTTYHFIHVYKNCPKVEEAIFHRKKPVIRSCLIEKNSVTMQFLEFSCDLILKIVLETYYKEGMVPEATGVPKKKKKRVK